MPLNTFLFCSATVRSAIHAIESNFPPAKNGIEGVRGSKQQARSQQKPNKAFAPASAEVGKPPKIPADHHQTKPRAVKAIKTTPNNNNNQVTVSKIDSWNNQVLQSFSVTRASSYMGH